MQCFEYSRFLVHLNARLFSPPPPEDIADDDSPRNVENLSLGESNVCGAGSPADLDEAVMRRRECSHRWIGYKEYRI